MAVIAGVLCAVAVSTIAYRGGQPAASTCSDRAQTYLPTATVAEELLPSVVLVADASATAIVNCSNGVNLSAHPPLLDGHGPVGRTDLGLAAGVTDTVLLYAPVAGDEVSVQHHGESEGSIVQIARRASDNTCMDASSATLEDAVCGSLLTGVWVLEDFGSESPSFLDLQSIGDPYVPVYAFDWWIEGRDLHILVGVDRSFGGAAEVSVQTLEGAVDENAERPPLRLVFDQLHPPGTESARSAE